MREVATNSSFSFSFSVVFFCRWMKPFSDVSWYITTGNRNIAKTRRLPFSSINNVISLKVYQHFWICEMNWWFSPVWAFRPLDSLVIWIGLDVWSLVILHFLVCFVFAQTWFHTIMVLWPTLLQRMMVSKNIKKGYIIEINISWALSKLCTCQWIKPHLIQMARAVRAFSKTQLQ